MSYRKLVAFGPKTYDDPAAVCLGFNPAFDRGSNAAVYGQSSPECQIYLSKRCAANWDELCERASGCRANVYATRADTMGAGMRGVIDLTPGDVLVRNTAMEKYRVAMRGNGNCFLRTEQFDPVNPDSPCLSHYIGTGCVPEYAVDPLTIDDDPVMNKLLDNPRIGIQILLNIRNTMRRRGTLWLLRGTRLGCFLGV